MGEVVSLAGAKQRCGEWRAAGCTVVFTNGHFDVMHVGHVDVLQRASVLGDVLIVGLNSDASTRQLKGPLRPIVPQADRARMLAALSSVDLVIIYDELTASRLVEELQPDVYAKGGDWEPAQGKVGPPEVAVVDGYGGEVRFLPYLPRNSTSALIETIVERFAPQAPAESSDTT